MSRIKFPLLSDSDSKTIDGFAVRNKGASGRQDGIPHPTTIIVDQEGIVRAKLPGEVRTRHSTEALLAALAELKE